MGKGKGVNKACNDKDEVNCLFREVDELQFEIRGS